MQFEQSDQYLEVEDFVLPLALYDYVAERNLDNISNASQRTLSEQPQNIMAVLPSRHQDSMPDDLQFQQFNFELPDLTKNNGPNENCQNRQKADGLAFQTSGSVQSQCQSRLLQLPIQFQRHQMANKYLQNLMKYHEETRKDKVLRYLHKKNFRKFVKKICYDQRRSIAQSRQRVKGRFVASKHDFVMTQTKEVEIDAYFQ